MPYRILVFSYRKPGLTPAEFRDRLENDLMPLLKALTGEHFPPSHTRHYIQRTEAPKANSHTERNPTTPAAVFMGTQADFDYDAISEMIFADQAAWEAYIGELLKPDVAAKLAETENKMLDTPKSGVVVVGETFVTKGE